MSPSDQPRAEAIARAAKRLNDLREAWLNPPEWTERVPEVIPLGMETSPYPDRIVAKHGHEKDLADRTLTKLYNQRPAWLAAANQTLDTAVAAAYGRADYTAEMPDEEILKRLLGLKDRMVGLRVQVRIDRLENGNAGDFKVVREGVSELRIDFGPGYRVYFAQRDPLVIVLLVGGDKRAQDADIARAIEMLKTGRNELWLQKTLLKKLRRKSFHAGTLRTTSKP